MEFALTLKVKKLYKFFYLTILSTLGKWKNLDSKVQYELLEELNLWGVVQLKKTGSYGSVQPESSRSGEQPYGFHTEKTATEEYMMKNLYDNSRMEFGTLGHPYGFSTAIAADRNNTAGNPYKGKNQSVERDSYDDCMELAEEYQKNPYRRKPGRRRWRVIQHSYRSRR